MKAAREEHQVTNMGCPSEQWLIKMKLESRKDSLNSERQLPTQTMTAKLS